jgi:HPr kinase/phosphorylase
MMKGRSPKRRIAQEITLHGNLVDVFGIGVLILGESGTGKSECALDLVDRGHRLVADDVICIRKEKQEVPIGEGDPSLRHHMEIRGLGIINIADLYGVSAIRHRQRVELVVQLEAWDAKKEYDRLGIDEHSYSLLGYEIPMVTIPVTAGRNIAILIEVAARNHLLKLMGVHSARDFSNRMAGRISRKSGPSEEGGGCRN